MTNNLGYSCCLQVHAYERSNRVFKYTLDPCAPIYITVGDGGNREKMAIPHADDSGNCPDPASTPDTPECSGQCFMIRKHAPKLKPTFQPEQGMFQKKHS